MSKLFSQDSFLVKCLERLIDVIILNTLFLLTSLPVITIGASLVAMSKVNQKIVKKEQVDVVSVYWATFKSNFKQATLIWIAILFLGSVLLINTIFATHSSNNIMKILTIIACLLLLNLTTYVFPYIARYDDSIRVSLSNAWLISLKYILHSGLSLVVNACVIYFFVHSAIGLLTFIYFATFGGIAMWQLVNSILIVNVFNKIERVMA